MDAKGKLMEEFFKDSADFQKEFEAFNIKYGAQIRDLRISKLLYWDLVIIGDSDLTNHPDTNEICDKFDAFSKKYHTNMIGVGIRKDDKSYWRIGPIFTSSLLDD